MTKHIHWVLFAFTLLALPHVVSAQEAIDTIDRTALKQQADAILQSDPAIKQVTLRVEVKPVTPPNTNVINFADLDLNGDGILARDEVGERLFRVFDTDNNQVIDNLEMTHPQLIVLTPMEKKTIEIIDYQAANFSTKEVVSTEDFLYQSKLAQFDKDKDGLSALDFLGKPFNQVNVRKDSVIDLYEFKRAYAEAVRPLHMEDYNYNS